MYQYFPYIILSVISFFTITFLIYYALLNRHVMMVKEFVFGLLALAWWVFCQAFELAALTLPVKMFWANLLYLGSTLSTFALLLLVMRFTGYQRYITKKLVYPFVSICVLFFLLVCTDQYHGLMRTNITLDTSAVPYIIAKDYGMVFPLYVLFTYGMNLTSLVLLATASIKKHSVFRHKARIFLVGLSIIPLSNICYILGLSPVKRFDITPAFFWVSAIIVSWGIFHHRLLNIMPIARELLVEIISSGIVVADKDSVLVDINQASLAMFQLQKSDVIGKSLSVISALDDSLTSANSGQAIITYKGSGEVRLLKITLHPLYDPKGKEAGTLWVIDDITEARKNMEKIVQQEKTLSAMREREKLGRILHDGLGQVFGYYTAQGQAVKEHLMQKNYPIALKHLTDLVAVSRDHHLTIREQISDIRGVSLINRCFSSALKQYAADFSETHGIPVEISFDDDLPPDFPADETGAELLSIIQEALTNVRKHAGPCSVEIRLACRDEDIEVLVSDTGTGFNPRDERNSHSFGLSIMGERAAEIGAALRIDSEIGKGTKIHLTIKGGEHSADCNC